MDKQILDEFTQSLKSSYDAYYLGFAMHPEEGREVKINDELLKIKNDLTQIDDALITAGNQVYSLMTNTILRLNNIHANIMMEKERYQDMQMLCNKYTDYDKVRALDNTDFKGDFVYEEGDFAPSRSTAKSVNLHIVDIFGNGYEGNKYVYKDYIYTNTVLDTSVRTNIIDDKITSYYEYSRITVNNMEDAQIPDFNKDNKEAQCTITFRAEEAINEIDIKSDDSTVIITNVAYSVNGVDFINMSIPYISINNKLDSYDNYGYIYGSGRIIFPQKVQLFKVTFQSNGYKNDAIAFQKTLLATDSITSTDPWADPLSEELDSDDLVEEVTTLIKSGQRHVIKINQVKAYMYQYASKSKIQSVEVLNQEAYSIALFANVYVPQGLSDDAVKFILSVNGHDYEIVPINSHMNGIKIIRFSTGDAKSPYTQRIGEVIKSAYLTVVFTNEAKIAPRINNIKILYGGEL